MADPIRVLVRDLQPGDVLIPTGREVVRVSQGVRTPTGKLDVDLRYPKTGVEKRFTYNQGTVIPVQRP
ncbi:MAG TPA: hypothetical protein VLA89_11125 [Gemmatimonadales bacterium]|nr:hypothetical protein [Gemmatimonadales bacterium]